MSTTINEQGVELGPDGKEWAKTAAGYKHVDTMLPYADVHTPFPVWHGWALRQAFVAGAEWQEARKRDAEACHHDDTQRLGAIWTRCNQCGRKWADGDVKQPHSGIAGVNLPPVYPRPPAPPTPQPTVSAREKQLLFALQSAWPYVHGWCSIFSVRNEVTMALFGRPSRDTHTRKVKEVAINYAVLREYGQKHNLDYNELCRVARDAVGVTP